MPSGSARVAALGLAIVLWCGACGASTKCNVACPAAGVAGAPIDQSLLPSAIVTLTADPPCSVTRASADGGGETFISVQENGPPTSGSCQIHARLADGSSWVAIFSWAPINSVCCGSSIQSVGLAPMFTPGND
jgi:hypothetical protein